MNIETLAAKYSAIPSHWKLSTLGESLTAIIGGGTPSRDNPSFWDGDIPWLTVKDMRGRRPTDAQEHITQQAVKESATNIIPPDTVIIASRVGLGKVVRVPFSAAINQDLKALVVGPDLDKSYLEYWLLSIATFLESIGSGTTVKGIRLETLRQLPIPLAPLEEQCEIVAELEKQFSRLDEAVANLQRVKANLKRYKASVLKAAVEGRLVETEATLSREKQKKFESATVLLQRAIQGRRFKKFSAPEQGFAALPDGWVWAPVEQLAANDANSIGAGPFGTIFKAKDFRPAGVPIIFLRHVAPLKYLTRKPGFMDVGKWEELFRPYSVFGGELLITKLGEPPGVCAQYPVGIGPAMVTPDVIKLSVNDEVVNSEYLMYYFNSNPAKRFATGAAFGTTRTRLTLPLFREMPVPLPPLAEQARIVAEVDRHLSIIREVEAEVDTNIQRAQALRQATLQRAFAKG